MIDPDKCSGGYGMDGMSMCELQHPDEPSVWCDECQKGAGQLGAKVKE